MSTKNCFLAVEPSTSEQAIVDCARVFGDIIDDGPDAMFVWIQRADNVAAVRWFGFAASEARCYALEPLLEILRGDLPEIVVGLHDDQNGVYLFERYARPPGQEWARRTLAVMSDGHRVGVLDGTVSIDYAQKGFTNDELDAIVNDKEPDAMTEREATAVMEWDNAIRIGLAQCYPTEDRRYLSALSTCETFQVREGGALCTPKQIGELPWQAHSIVQFFPDSHHWRQAGLQERTY